MLSVPDDGYSRNALWAPNLISTLLFLSLGRYLCWWTISHRGYYPPSSQCFGTDMVYYYMLLKIKVITKLPNSEQSYKCFFLSWKVKTHNYINRNKISQQPENCENRKDPDLVQVFLKKLWVESDFKAPNLPLSLRFKGSGCHCNMVYYIYVIEIYSS